MTWQRITSCFGIRRRTLYRHRQILGVGPLRYAVLSNQDLDSIVTTILQNTPNVGEAYVLGSLGFNIKWIPLGSGLDVVILFADGSIMFRPPTNYGTLT